MRLALMMLMLATRAANAAPCGGLHGEAGLVSAVGDLLEQRGVNCADVRGEVRLDGASIVVTREGDTIPVERRVADLATAATVIESWSDRNASDPLLASHPIPAIVVAAAPVAPPPRVVIVERQAPPPPSFHGSQLFAAAETSYANDRTTWAGAQVGGCVVIGPLCAEASVRFANVIDGPAFWTGLDRRSIEVLIGGDVPISVGAGLLLLGFGGGTGQVHTRVDSRDDHRMASETGGLRAEVHAAYAYPLTRSIALDLAFSLDLTQATRSEKTTTMPLPDEPLLLARLGFGLRWGHLQ
ncbi:MAG: hypothetical protein ABI467_23835 [Kofleriaceae bacterium]